MATNEVSLNIHDHGTIVDDHKRRIKCNYCSKVVSGVTRLKCHLGGIRGDVSPCEAVPTNVKDLMRNNFLEHKRGNLSKEVGELCHPNLPWKRNRSAHSKVVEEGNSDIIQPAGSESKRHANVDSVPENRETKVASFPKRRMFPQVAANTIGDSSSVHAQKCIGRFFYETGLDFTASNSLSFQKMVNVAFGCNQITGLRIPSCQELKGWILEDEVKEMQRHVNKIRNSWTDTGCSILLDGWIDGMGRNLVNILAGCPQGPIYLSSLDISSAFGNVDALQQLLEEVIEEVGVDNVVQIITYSTSAFMEAVGKQLMERYKKIFWTVSASHCLELMLEKVGMMDFIKEIVEKAKSITKFIYSRSTVLKLMRNYTSVPDLVKPSKIRAAMPFLTLENIVSEQENLQLMFFSPEWNTSIWATSREGKAAADLMIDRSFWTGATSVLKATIPLVRVLQLIDESDKPLLGYIYETIDQAKETIRDEFKRKKYYMPVWTTIDDVWNNHLHSPLHSAGYFLNPSLFYSSDFFPDAEVASGLLCCIVRMVEGKDIQDTISLQVDMYREGKGSFGLGSDLHQRSSISPAQWWSHYGVECPDLQKLAIRILSQTCDGAAKYQLKRSVAEKLLTKGRNRIEQERLNDLTFLHYNLHLRNFELRASSDILFDELDPMDDWIADGTEDAILQNSEPTWMELNCRNETATRRVNAGEGPSSSRPKVEPSSTLN